MDLAIGLTCTRVLIKKKKKKKKKNDATCTSPRAI